MADLRAKVKQFLGREFNHTEVLIANSIDTNWEFRILKWDVKDESGNPIAQPSQEQLDALDAEADIAEKEKQAIRKRFCEYPSLGDIADAIFKKEAGDSTEFDSLEAKRQATKTNYPKE